MAKKKSSAPKTEAKVRSVKPKAVKEKTAPPKTTVFKGTSSVEELKKTFSDHEKAGLEEIKSYIAKKHPIRFNTGDVIKHEGRLYQCISVNGHHDAILAAYSHQNNRADHSKVMTVSNDPSTNDGFTFSKY